MVGGTDRFSPDVRVNVTPGAGPVRIAVDGPYEVRPIGSDRIVGRGSSLEPSRVMATSTGLRVGETRYPASRLEISVGQSPAIWVGPHQYRGSLRLYQRPGGRIVAVNVLPLPDYLASVVDSEMPMEFPDAARRAQAIAARTYVLYQMQHRAISRLFDVHATTQSQRYLGYQYRGSAARRLAGESANSRRIVAETAGQVCTWRGRLLCTYYFAVCGGRTTPGDEMFDDDSPPLQGVACRWCRDAERFRWHIVLPNADLAQSLRAYLERRGLPWAHRARVSTAQRSNTTAACTLSDGPNHYRLSRRELMQALPPGTLPSDRFTVEQTAHGLAVRGRGHGHGVGLCQWGARGLALAGRDCLQIIRYYYPGVRIVVLESDSVPRTR